MRVRTDFPYREVLVRVGKRISIYSGVGGRPPLLWVDRVEIYHNKIVIMDKEKVHLK